VPSFRIASPERWAKAAAAPGIAGVAGWLVAGSVHLGLRPGTAPALPQAVRIGVTCAAVATGAWLAIRILREHLTVSDHGLLDQRILRVIQVPWDLIAQFEVGHPAGLWGGYCVSAVCRDGATIDLMSTRAYSRIPSARHLDELHRICWTLNEAVRQRSLDS
jgi:hypothetical protein